MSTDQKAKSGSKSKLSSLEKLQLKMVGNVEKQVDAITSTPINKTDLIIKQSLAQSQTTTENQLQLKIPVDMVDDNPSQPRRNFDQKKLIEFAESIKITGQIEPIVVREMNGRYQLIAGERRLRAFKILKWPMIEAVIRDVDDGMSALMALSENYDREDLSDYEFALGIINAQNQFATKTQLAEYIKRPRIELYRYLSFDDLPSWVKARLDANPFILNRHTAFALKNLLAEPGSENLYKDHIIKAMDAIERNALTQELFIDRVQRLARESVAGKNTATLDPSKFVKKQYMLKGKKVGNLKFNEKGLAISIQHDSIGEGDIDAIYEFIQQRLQKGEGIN